MIAERDEFIPPANSAPLADLLGSEDIEILRVPGGHAGALMGSAARRVTMPRVVDWLQRHPSSVAKVHAPKPERKKACPQSDETLFESLELRSARVPPTAGCWPGCGTATSGSS